MGKVVISSVAGAGETHVARDPKPASEKVQRAVSRRLKKALSETAEIKARRSRA